MTYWVACTYTNANAGWQTVEKNQGGDEWYKDYTFCVYAKKDMSTGKSKTVK
jgi:hypothetical protein